MYTCLIKTCCPVATVSKPGSPTRRQHRYRWSIVLVVAVCQVIWALTLKLLLLPCHVKLQPGTLELVGRCWSIAKHFVHWRVVFNVKYRSACTVNTSTLNFAIVRWWSTHTVIYYLTTNSKRATYHVTAWWCLSRYQGPILNIISTIASYSFCPL